MGSKKFIVGCVIALGTYSTSVKATLIGCGFSGTLYDINQSTAQTSNVRTTTSQLTDIAKGPNGMVYAANAGASGGQLYTVNLSNGATTVVGPTGLASFIEGDLAFSPGGTLYGFDVLTKRLCTFNTTTGAGTYLGTTGTEDDVSALFFVGSSLYGVDDRINAGGAGIIYKLNPADGSVLSSTSSNITFGSALAGGEVDPATGTIYVASGGNTTGSLYTLNLGTSTFSLVGTSVGLADVSGITFVSSSVPEPSTLGVISAATAGFLSRRKRR